MQINTLGRVSLKVVGSGGGGGARRRSRGGNGGEQYQASSRCCPLHSLSVCVCARVCVCGLDGGAACSPGEVCDSPRPSPPPPPPSTLPGHHRQHLLPLVKTHADTNVQHKHGYFCHSPSTQIFLQVYLQHSEEAGSASLNKWQQIAKVISSALIGRLRL